jgi:hypothetical protein
MLSGPLPWHKKRRQNNFYQRLLSGAEFQATSGHVILEGYTKALRDTRDAQRGN